jgi:hypothetical protein
MGGASRFAWHGVPRIVSGSCPAYLREWPAAAAEAAAEEGEGDHDDDDNDNDNDAASDSRTDEYEHWRGWMAGKLVNLNVRQMWG